MRVYKDSTHQEMIKPRVAYATTSEVWGPAATEAGDEPPDQNENDKMIHDQWILQARMMHVVWCVFVRACVCVCV